MPEFVILTTKKHERLRREITRLIARNPYLRVYTFIEGIGWRFDDFFLFYEDKHTFEKNSCLIYEMH